MSALSRSAARTARQRRWLWALAACGGAAGLVAVEGQLHEQAQERGQTTVEYAQERAAEAANSLKKTSGVAGALLRTAMSAALAAVQQRNFDPGHFHADLAATVADLASETPTRRHLVALGGGYFLDWLLQLAYPNTPGSSNSDGNSGGSAFPGGGGGVGGGPGMSNGNAGLSVEKGFGRLDGRFGGLSPWSEPAAGERRREAAAGLQVLPVGSEGSAPDAGSQSAAVAAARLCREAERALESILRDDVAAGLLLDRPGAVPLLLRAVADGWASGGVVDALTARAAEARSASEAMTADLREAVDVLRGRIAGRSGSGSSLLSLQCTAAGLLSAWAAGSGSNRAKLTGLGLQDVVAEVTTAASGLSDRAAVGLQWELLRLARVMAEHSSSSDSHHLAACVLPLLYTAADAAAAEDAAMASYAVDTLATAVRHGGPPVAEVVANSTMPHLLWQLAEVMAARRVLAEAAPAPPAADGKDGAPSGTGGAAAGANAAAAAKSKAAWFLGRSGGASTAAATGREGSSAAAAPASAAGGGAGGGAAPAAPPAKSRKVLRVQDPAVAASVAAAVAELARCSLLPEEQVPRWRDWLLDVLCADGFDPVTLTAGAAAAASGGGGGPTAAAITAVASRPSTAELERASGHAPLRRRRDMEAAGAATSSFSGGVRLQPRLPAWLKLPEAVRQPGGAGSGGGAAPAAARGSEQRLNAEREGGLGEVRGSVVAALAALSHMPGNHGLQAAHYWLSRLLSELAARTLPYTSLVYLEGPRAPQDLIHAVPVLPSYVKSVADALERAADAVADDSPPLPPHLEFDLAGSGLVGRPTHHDQPRKAKTQAKASGGSKQGAGIGAEAQRDAAAADQQGQGQRQQRDAQQAAADVAAYRQAAHVVDVVVAERKAADALEALCAIVAPDPHKQRWLLQRGVLPLLHRLTRTADDPRAVLQEQGQPGAERVEWEAAAVGSALAGAGDLTSTTAPPLGSDPHRLREAQAQSEAVQAHVQRQHPHPQPQRHSHALPNAHHQHQQPTQQELRQGLQQAQLQQGQQRQGQQQPGQQQPGQQQQQAPAVVSELMSDHEGGPSLCLQRQVARMLALLALLPDARADVGGRGSVLDAAVSVAAGDGGGSAAVAASRPQDGDAKGGGGWLSWLHHAAASSDCRLSSNATRALLHMAGLDAAAAAAADATPGAASGADGGHTAAAAAAAPPPPVFLDGIHLLDPGARHHWALVRQVATAATETAALAAEVPAAGPVAAPTMSPAAAAADGVGGDAGEEDSRLPTSPGAPGAAVAVSMAAAAETLALKPAATGSDLAAFGASAAGSAAAVTMGCGAAGVGGLAAAALHQGPSLATTLLGTMRYLTSLPFSLWGATALAASYGGAATAVAPPPPPAMAAATAAEPLQASPRTAATAAAAGSAPATTAPIGGLEASGSLIPPSATPPYPAPYPDESTPDADVLPPSAPLTSPEAATSPPSVDVVFVHGIRGGPFITWRKAGVMTRGSAASHMERSACWPSTWLAEDLPGARLLSVEYLAPVSAWEGESLPLEDNVSRVMGQLAAAGVGTGQRPVVFVAHSMGGLLVKEMLARSMDQAAEGGGPNAALASSTRGIVFFGTPHFGNAIAAMGWKLRYVPGALPAPSLARLTPGPHLLSLNDRLRQLHDTQAGAMRVVSLLEGQPTQLSGVIPRILIVAPDSAYPGFGAALTLPHNDHIDCCKPAGRTDPAYRVVRDLVLHAMRAAAPAGGRRRPHA